MMINFNRASYTASRAVALALVWLSVAPVFAGSYAMLHHPVQQLRSSGESVVYKSHDVTVVYKNQYFNATQSHIMAFQALLRSVPWGTGTFFPDNALVESTLGPIF